MPPKGGVRQQLKRARDELERLVEIRESLESDDEAVVDKMRTFRAGGRAKAATAAAFLTGMFVTGRISANEVEEGASASSSSVGNSGSGCIAPSLAGSSGKNASRNVMRRIGKTSSMPALYSTYIPIWCNKTNRKINDIFKFLLPHEVINNAVLETNLQDWLSPVSTTIGFTVQKWKERVGYVGDAVGFGLWGDSATYFTRDSLYVIMANAVTGVRKRRYWLCAFSKKSLCACGCGGRCTLDGIWRVLSWSFTCLLNRRWPSVRDDMMPFDSSEFEGDRERSILAGGDLAVGGGVVQKRGDWSWLKNGIGMVGWGDRDASGEVRCCFKCDASIAGRHPYDDFSDGASWRDTILTHEIFMQRVLAMGLYLSGVFSLPGFIVTYISGDLMHTGELGVLQHMLGACLWEWFQSVGGIVTKPKPTLDMMLSFIRTASKSLRQERLPFNTLTLGMIKGKKTSSSPKLKAKASEASRLLACLVYIFERLFPPRDAHQTTRL